MIQNYVRGESCSKLRYNFLLVFDHRTLAKMTDSSSGSGSASRPGLPVLLVFPGDLFEFAELLCVVSAASALVLLVLVAMSVAGSGPGPVNMLKLLGRVAEVGL